MRRLLVCLFVLAFTAPISACEWDYDTLQMERERFPGALELIVGKFLRHSEPFYEWRVKDRRADIAAHEAGEKKLTTPHLARTYDDLAVALDKLKRHDEAIEVIREKAEQLPNVGEYETHANLGTFLAHSGRLEEGVAELQKAIEINPDAHFGREKYQVLLIEYVLEKRGENEQVSLPLDESYRHRGAGPFANWLLEDQLSHSGSDDEIDTEIEQATKGVLGMMRFGDYRSPVLLEALGDLVSARIGADDGSAQRLASRAYLRAAETVESPEAKAAYREMAEAALEMQYPDEVSGEAHSEPGSDVMGMSLASIESQLAREVHEADDWFERTIVYDEELWIEKSADPDAAFWNKYGGQEIRLGHDRLPAAKFAFKGLPFAAIIALVIGFLTTIGAVAALIAWRRKRPTGYNNKPTHTV